MYLCTTGYGKQDIALEHKCPECPPRSLAIHAGGAGRRYRSVPCASHLGNQGGNLLAVCTGTEPAQQVTPGNSAQCGESDQVGAITWKISQVALTEGLPRITPKRSPEIWHQWLWYCWSMEDPGAWRHCRETPAVPTPGLARPRKSELRTPTPGSVGADSQPALGHRAPQACVDRSRPCPGGVFRCQSPAQASEMKPAEGLLMTSPGPCQGPFWAPASPGTPMPSVVLWHRRFPDIMRYTFG